MDAHPSDRDDPVVAAARAGDEAAFARLVERHRRELRVHCYRMVGSVDEPRTCCRRRSCGRGGTSAALRAGPRLRAWLYRMATNACLDAFDGRARRVLPQDLEPATTGAGAVPVVDVGEIFHDAGGVFHHSGAEGRMPGPDPGRSDHGSFASFSDPDGDGWLLQEVKTRAPGR